MLKLTTDRHEALRGLFATAELLVYVLTGRHLGAAARDTVAFLERERDARNASSSRRLYLFTGHISSTNSDNFEPVCHNN